MRFAPVFNSAGQLLGHVDLNRCIMQRDCYVVDENAGRIGAWNPGTVMKNAVRFYRFPLRQFKFRWGTDESVVRHMVVDEPIPDWAWAAAGIKFNGAQDWERS